MSFSEALCGDVNVPKKGGETMEKKGRQNMKDER
jgi:hypothetical protein